MQHFCQRCQKQFHSVQGVGNEALMLHTCSATPFELRLADMRAKCARQKALCKYYTAAQDTPNWRADFTAETIGNNATSQINHNADLRCRMLRGGGYHFVVTLGK